MKAYRVTRMAQADIVSILVFIMQDNANAADQLADRFEEAFLLLSTQPRMGETCDDLRKGLRKYPLGNYLIFYLIKSRRIEIFRVIHGSRNLDRIFQN